MTEKEIQILLKHMEKNRKQTTASKKKALAFLKELGVLTDGGNLKQQYAGLCMLDDQD